MLIYKKIQIMLKDNLSYKLNKKKKVITINLMDYRQQYLSDFKFDFYKFKLNLFNYSNFKCKMYFINW